MSNPTVTPESPEPGQAPTREAITPERLALAVERVSTDLMRHLRGMAETTFEPNLFRRDVDDLGIVLSALTTATAEVTQLRHENDRLSVLLSGTERDYAVSLDKRAALESALTAATARAERAEADSNRLQFLEDWFSDGEDILLSHDTPDGDRHNRTWMAECGDVLNVEDYDARNHPPESLRDAIDAAMQSPTPSPSGANQ